MYGNEPAQWDDSLTGADRLRVIVNALTRLRFCTPEGVMDLKASGGLEDAAARATCPGSTCRAASTAGTPIAFGHWSTLGYLQRPDMISTGHRLRLGRLPERAAPGRARAQERELIQVKCAQAQKPG